MQAPPLDTALLHFSKKDAWTVRDSFEGTQIFGATGSGKTSGSGATIAKAFLTAGYGGMVQCAKPEERTLWERYAQATGRSSDLVIIGKDAKWRMNFLDYELRRKGDGAGLTENLVNLLTTIVEIAEGKADQATADRFWERAMKELLRNGVDLLSIANRTLTLEDINRLITDAPQTADQVKDTSWQQGSWCWQLLMQGHDRQNKNDREKHDLDTAARYWLATYPKLSDRTRTSVVATFTSVADILLHGLAWEMFCTSTTIVPEVTYKNGAILILDFSIQEYGQLGRIIQGIFKFMFQRAVLRRIPADDPRPVFLWADESQNFISNFDYQYQSVARSALAATVYLTQNISNYYSVLKSRDETHALLGNLQTKIFHGNSDYQTNQYAADVIAMERTTSFGFSSNENDLGSSRGSSGNDTVRYKVMPGAFTTLRKGGEANKAQVEAILFQGGRTFRATGDTYLKTIFKQS